MALTTIGAYDQGLYIIPKDICEKYGVDKIADEDCIGTGPYKYVEHLPDRYVLLERYDGYVPTDNEGASGMAAPKMPIAMKSISILSVIRWPVSPAYRPANMISASVCPPT